MAYTAREIVDRVATGDDLFRIEQLGDGRTRITPAPDSVTAVGTPINRELLQIIEDRVVWLMNRLYDDITSNPFNVSFENLSGVTVTGVWNDAEGRIEC
jgi:hypothetical protein